MTILIGLLSGILFGLGLSIADMINPHKIINFLDIVGDWDPSLAFVMIGALIPSAIAFYWIRKRNAPLLDSQFHTSNLKHIDRPLMLGSATFGVGWGISGFCPGPAVTGLSFFNPEALVMVISIYLGFIVQKFIVKKLSP